MIKEFKLLDSEKEEGRRLQKISGGGGLGASMGIILCLMNVFAGVPISWPEMLVVIISAGVFGAAMGFLSS